MTYRTLQNILGKLSQEQLDMDVIVDNIDWPEIKHIEILAHMQQEDIRFEQKVPILTYKDNKKIIK